MDRRHVRPIPVERLSTLTTPRLLAYRDRLLSLEESVEASDIQFDWELHALNPELMYFKSDARWLELYAAVKAELSRREHVSNR